MKTLAIALLTLFVSLAQAEDIKPVTEGNLVVSRVPTGKKLFGYDKCSVNVLIDDKQVGTLDVNQKLVFDLPVAVHTITFVGNTAVGSSCRTKPNVNTVDLSKVKLPVELAYKL